MASALAALELFLWPVDATAALLALPGEEPRL